MRLSVIICSLMLLSSCATLYTGTKNIIYFSTEPQGSTVTINGKPAGVTPLPVKLKRGFKKSEVTFSKNGYNEKTIPLKKKFVLISLLSNTLIPIDIVSGAITRYREKYHHIIMEPTGGKKDVKESFNAAENFYVIVKNDTIYSRPFQKFDYEFFLSPFIENIDFVLHDGSKKSYPIADVSEFRTLEITKGRFGMGYFQINTGQEIKEQKFIKVLYQQKKQRTIYMFMEEMLEKGEYHLVKSKADSYTDMQSGGIYYIPDIYYLYKEGTLIEKVKEKELLATVQKYFADQKKLISLLQQDSRYKVVERFVYPDKKLKKKII